MGAQRGRDLLLKVDADNNGTFVTVAGLRARQVALNATSVDITSADSVGRWRELLEGAGTRAASLSGSGLFTDGQSDALMRDLFFNGQIRPWQVIVPDFGTLQGPFQITALEYAGRHDNEVTFELALSSAGGRDICGALTAQGKNNIRKLGSDHGKPDTWRNLGPARWSQMDVGSDTWSPCRVGRRVQLSKPCRPAGKVFS